MSRSYSGNTSVSVNYKGQDVDVYLEYQVDIDSNYGADADGRRGVYREEVEVTCKYIEGPPDLHFTGEQTDEILSMAESQFLKQQGWKENKYEQ